MHHRPSRPFRAPLAALGALLVSAAFAAPLTQTTAVQTQPDPAAPSFTYLKAGAEPVPASEGIAEAPAGWMMVSVTGPFTGYVPNQDLTKGLEVKLGASVYLAPKADAGVLTIAADKDRITLTGLLGKWTQVKVDRAVTGYIHLGPLPALPAGPAAAAAAASPEPRAATPAAEAGVPPAPPAPVDLSTTTPSAAAGRPAAATEGGAELPRFFEGRFASSKRLIGPHRPYPWQLEGSDGTRLAYVDIGHLLLMDQIDSYAGHDVQIFGPVRDIPGSKDIVIVAESLRLK